MYTDATKIVNWSPRLSAGVGDKSQLTCNARHDASLSVNYRWLFNDKPVEVKTEDREVNGDRLLLSRMSGHDTGNYTCVAETELDSTSQTAMVVVRGALAWAFPIRP